MTETTRKTQEEELNQAVNLWKNAVKAGKDTEQQKEQVWICFFDWCKDWDTIQDPLYTDITEKKSINLLNLFYKTLQDFDPDRGIPYSRYFGSIWHERKKDSKKAIERKNNTASLDAPLVPNGDDEGDDDLLETTIADENQTDIDHRIELEDRLADLASLILNLRERIGSRAANPTGERWYRMFFAEDITKVIKTVPLHFTHEDDIMNALYQNYLDYYTTQKCSSTAQIRKTPLEPLSKFTENAADTEEITWERFPVCVSLTYLSRCENAVYAASEYSNKRKTYKEIMKRENI